MHFIGSVQSVIILVLGIAAFAVEIFALVDAARHRADAYVAASKRTKNFWLVVTGAAALIGFVFIWSPLNFIGIIAIVAAGVYLADVRPALQQVSGRRRPEGPYGPW